jgi:hypothetical protein
MALAASRPRQDVRAVRLVTGQMTHLLAGLYLLVFGATVAFAISVMGVPF